MILAIAFFAWIFLPILVVTSSDARWFALIVLGGVTEMVLRAPLGLLLMSDGNLYVWRLFRKQVVPVSDILSIERVRLWVAVRSYTTGPQYVITYRGGSVCVPLGPIGSIEMMEHLMARNPEIRQEW